MGPHGYKKNANLDLINLPAHKSLHITGTMLFVDAWEEAKFYITVDGKTVWTQGYSYSMANTSNQCGAPDFKPEHWQTEQDHQMEFDITVAHTKGSASIKFWTGSGQSIDTESFGITDLQVRAVLCNSNADCLFKNGKQQCTCKDGYSGDGITKCEQSEGPKN